MLLTQALERAHQQLADDATPRPQPPEHLRGDAEQLAQQPELGLGSLLGALERRSAPPRQPGHDGLEGPDGAGDQAAEPVGAHLVLDGGSVQIDGNPCGTEAVGDAEGDQGEQRGWLRNQVMRAIALSTLPPPRGEYDLPTM
jgi:hypothetical protein